MLFTFCSALFLLNVYTYTMSNKKGQWFILQYVARLSVLLYFSVILYSAQIQCSSVQPITVHFGVACKYAFHFYGLCFDLNVEREI